MLGEVESSNGHPRWKTELELQCFKSESRRAELRGQRLSPLSDARTNHAKETSWPLSLCPGENSRAVSESYWMLGEEGGQEELDPV